MLSCDSMFSQNDGKQADGWALPNLVRPLMFRKGEMSVVLNPAACENHLFVLHLWRFSFSGKWKTGGALSSVDF